MKGLFQSSVIAGIEAQLLVFYSDPKNFVRPGLHSATQEVVKILTYVALIFSISATMSSLLLTDEFGEIPTRAARSRGKDFEGGRFAGTDWSLLRSYRIRAGSRLVVYHCEYEGCLRTLVPLLTTSDGAGIACLLTACLCTIASAAAYAGSQESLATQIIVSLVAVIAISPLLWLAFPP